MRIFTKPQTIITHHNHKNINLLHRHSYPVDFKNSFKMSGAAQGSTSTTKATVSDANNTEKPLSNEQKPAAQLEEDDEFEDFPMEGRHTYEE